MQKHISGADDWAGLLHRDNKLAMEDGCALAISCLGMCPITLSLMISPHFSSNMTQNTELAGFSSIRGVELGDHLAFSFLPCQTKHFHHRSAVQLCWACFYPVLIVVELYMCFQKKLRKVPAHQDHHHGFRGSRHNDSFINFYWSHHWDTSSVQVRASRHTQS